MRETGDRSWENFGSLVGTIIGFSEILFWFFGCYVKNTYKRSEGPRVPTVSKVPQVGLVGLFGYSHFGSLREFRLTRRGLTPLEEVISQKIFYSSRLSKQGVPVTTIRL